MAFVVNVQEVKTGLSELLARVEAGEDVVVATSGKPVAHLAPVERTAPRTFGAADLTVPDTSVEPLPERELAAWE